MKRQLIIFAIFIFTYSLFAQQKQVDRLRLYFKTSENEIYQKFENKLYDEALVQSFEMLDSCLVIPDQYPVAKIREQSYIYYNLACLYSLKGDRKLALDYLRKCIDTGDTDYTHMIHDSDLDALHGDTAYIRQLERIREIGDYYAILRKDIKYDTVVYQKPLQYTYQSSDVPYLTSIRNYFKLDSVAGNGDELSRIKNLMQFIHDSITIDDYADYPINWDTIDLYEKNKKQNQPIRSDVLNHMLNDCYLAMGFPSRVVYCYPKLCNTGYYPLNTVYSKTLEKWIFLDAAYNCYLTDDNGHLLSIWEVQKFLIENKNINVSPDANKNSINKRKFEKYIYMDRLAEYLYWFYNALDSKNIMPLNLHKDNRVPHIALLPVGGSYPVKFSYTLNRMLTVTHCPDLFWQKP